MQRRASHSVLKYVVKIGVIIVSGMNNLVVEYSLKDMNMPMGVSGFKVGDVLPEDLSDQLPSIEDIQKRIK